MNAVPTDDLRVVKRRCGLNENVIEDSFTAMRPALVVIAVQRRWLVPDGEPYDFPEPYQAIDIAVGPYRWQPRREEWRDLPEVEL